MQRVALYAEPDCPAAVRVSSPTEGANTRRSLEVRAQPTSRVAKGCLFAKTWGIRIDV
jgi:hypothetical protein